jgi:II/X family phage/plasmid replication protein
MLIDYLTLKLRYSDCPDWGGWRRMALWGDRICRVCARTGNVVWERNAWDSLRSDSHQISILANSSLIRISGSPARVMGDGDAVFGVGEAGRDLYCCVDAVLRFVQPRLHVSPLPQARLWHVRRVDITGNYDLGSLANVRIALKELAQTDGGRYRVSQQSGDSPYWNHSSALRSSKAYSKGPHLRQMVKKPGYSGRVYSENELVLSERLLRLEHSLKRLYFLRLRKRGIPWYHLKWSDLFAEYDGFFGQMIGTVESIDMTKHLDKLMQMPSFNDPSKRMSEAASKSVLRTLYSIQSIGRQATMEMMPTRTWYLHLKYLRQLGYGDNDLAKGNVSYLRRQIILNPVSSWDDLRKAA